MTNQVHGALLIVGIVALLGLSLLVMTDNPSGSAVVRGIQTAPSSASISPDAGMGRQLGEQAARDWDGSEASKYCSYACADLCTEQNRMWGQDRNNCGLACTSRCRDAIADQYFLDAKNSGW